MNPPNIYYQNGFAVVQIPPQFQREMRKRYQAMYHGNPKLNENTQTVKKASRLAGILGEIVFENIYPQARRSRDLNWDYNLQGNKIDVKCKLRKCEPNSHHEASLYQYQLPNSPVEIYYFMSTTGLFNRVWLCGWINREDMLKHPNAKRWERGERDETNGKVFSTDTLNLGYEYLRPVFTSKMFMPHFMVE